MLNQFIREGLNFLVDSFLILAFKLVKLTFFKAILYDGNLIIAILLVIRNIPR